MTVGSAHTSTERAPSEEIYSKARLYEKDAPSASRSAEAAAHKTLQGGTDGARARTHTGYNNLHTVQSFSNAVHPLWRSYDQKVAPIFRAEDDDREPRSPLIVP